MADDLKLLEEDPEVQQELYGSTGQVLGTALEGAANAATFGLSTLAERALGARGKDIIARREANPNAYMAGQVGGLVGSSLLVPGGGAAGLMEGAGGLAARGVQKGFGKILGAGAKGVVENAMLQSGDELAKMFASDPNQTAETAIANVGLSGAAGGLFSTGLAAAHPLWDATVGKKIGSILGAIKDKVSSNTGVSPVIQDALSASGIEISPEVKASMMENPYLRQMFQTLQESSGQSGVESQQALKNFRSNIKEYLSRGFNLGAEEAENLAESFSKYSAGSDARTALQQELISKAQPGIREETERLALQSEAPKQAALAIERTPEQIKSISGLSNEKRGQEIAKSVTGELQERLKPTIEAFDDISKNFKKEALSDIEKSGIVTRLDDLIREGQLDEAPSSPQYKLIKQIQAEVPNYRNLESLRNAQSRLNDYQFGTTEYQTAKNVKKVLRNLEGDLIEERYAFNHPEMATEARELVREARAQYAKSMDLIEALNDRLHVGRYGGPESFYAALRDMKPEDVLRRLSSSNDAGLLDILKSELPKTSELVRQSHLDSLAMKAADDGILNPVKLAQAVEGLTPELREFALKKGAQEAIEGLRGSLDKAPSIALEETMGTLDRMNKVLKLGKFSSPSEFFEKLSSEATLSNESLMNKLSQGAQKDASFLSDLQKFAPQTFDQLKRFEQLRILQKAVDPKGVVGERLNVNALFRLMKQQSPEWKNVILSPEILQRLEHANTLLSAIPEKMNPSGTAKTVDALLGDMPSSVAGVISGLLTSSPSVGVGVAALTKALGRDIPDATRLAILKFMGSEGQISTPAFMKMVNMIQNTIEGNSLASKAAKALIHSGEVVIPSRLMPDEKKMKKLDESVEKLQMDQSPLIERKDDSAMYAPEEDGAHGLALTQSLGYLASIRPGKDKELPLDSEVPIDPIKKAEYDRALEIAEQPLIVFKSINDGTLTQQDVTHLSSMFPSYYGMMQEKIMNELMDEKRPTISMKKQMMLSLFMGSPLTSSLEPQNIQSAQTYLSGIEQQKAQKQQAMQEQALKGGGKSLTKLAAEAQTPQQKREFNRMGTT